MRELPGSLPGRGEGREKPFLGRSTAHAAINHIPDPVLAPREKGAFRGRLIA